MALGSPPTEEGKKIPRRQVYVADGFRGADTELMARRVGWHLTDDATDDGHGVMAVRHPSAPLARGLRGAPVDDGDEVICDDDSVLAFLSGILRNDALLYYFHWVELRPGPSCVPRVCPSTGSGTVREVGPSTPSTGSGTVRA